MGKESRVHYPSEQTRQFIRWEWPKVYRQPHLFRRISGDWLQGFATIQTLVEMLADKAPTLQGSVYPRGVGDCAGDVFLKRERKGLFLKHTRLCQIFL